jgi:hypothetical protein
MTKTRRQFLHGALLASAALPLVLPFAALAGTGAGAEGERFFMINGWVLTEADVAMLRQHAS